MAKEICISSTPHETRLAILEDDQLSEIYYERENEYTLAGSIYNGRVTRVLPGMQSAFVDLGLERDAFLYVTDFLELEDQDESEELEKAAASGGNQPPREVRHGNGQSGERAPRREPRRADEDRGGREAERERRPSADAGTEVSRAEPASIEITADNADTEASGEAGEEGGAKRWRGRRRRRGGRATPGHVADPVDTEASAETYLEPGDISESDVAPEIHAAASIPVERPASPAPPGRAQRPERVERSPSRFVLPGESLSKYGGEPAAETGRPEAEPARPARPGPSFKPATLIEAPLEWDGSGLLPGESISRHRGRTSEPEVPAAMHHEPAGVSDEVPHPSLDEEFRSEESGAAIEATEIGPEESLPEFDTEEMVFEEEPEEQLPGAAAEPAVTKAADPFESDAFFATREEGFAQEEHSGQPREHGGTSHIAGTPVDPVIHEPSAGEPIAEPTHVQSTDPDRPEPGQGEPGDSEQNRSASHHVDPFPPSGFRLFGFGGKKKSEETGPPPPPVLTPAAAPQPATVKAVSAFAPGAGLVEEEVIEGEEVEVPRHHHGKLDEHDLDEYEEEEKLHTQIRSGELGEMLQEAHLDHRIQLDFDEKASEVEGDDVFDIEDEEEEAAEGEGQPAGNGALPDRGQPRRERGGRGRRGSRGTPPGRRGGPPRRSAQTSDLPIISDLLKPGQEILVQIAKEPIAKKGARITSHIALPGRFLVFMPTVTHVGVSRKISSDEERQRLKRILISERGDASGGFIVRTAAEGASEEELRSDLRFLIHLWDEIKQRSENSKSPALIYHDLSLIERILRDQINANFSSIWVDSETDYERIVRFLNRFAPSMVRRVKLYTKETPLFEHFGIQDEISKALRSKVWLKSGGSIVINQTEALVAIDINTGKYVGKTARLEDTIVKTNLDAIPEIVRQIRLRDLGGIIIIDFIDMDERKNRFKVMAALEEALKNDRAPTKVLQFNDFGLVAITRKRVKQSLERTLSVPCPTCQATGMVKSPTTVCNEIYSELRKMRRHFESADVVLRVNPETVKVLKANNARWLTEFEELVAKNILVKSDATLHPEQFDIQG
ncbi:MAG TPA: Rne/Rng family ribonuclease [Terracidiphilus sp.]|nr:Rne/Rng family ribonuclease [Terracidiphilus sp.]